VDIVLWSEPELYVELVVNIAELVGIELLELLEVLELLGVLELLEMLEPKVEMVE
jgi:hypothetical protein